jgi:hypothetical protein
LPQAPWPSHAEPLLLTVLPGQAFFSSHRNTPPLSTCCSLFSTFFTFVSINVWSCVALLFNFALLFDCANPWLECSLPRTPQSSTTCRFCLSRHSLLQSFAGSTGWL